MKIVWDIDGHKLIKAVTNAQQFQRIDWVMSDVLTVNLYIVEPDDSAEAYVQREAPAGWTPRFAVKAASALGDDPLVSQLVWTQVGEGDTAYYTAEVNLNTTELIEAVGSESYLDVYMEFVLQDVTGRNRDSTQHSLRVFPDVHRPTDGVPNAQSEWPWLEEFTHAPSGKKCLRLKNSDGEVCMEIGPPGVEL